MIPLRDDNPTRTFPIVTILLIAANVVVFLYEKASGPLFDAQFAMIPYKLVTGQQYLMGILHATNAGNLVFQPLNSLPQSIGPDDILIAPSPIPPWATIFTAMFMHANLLHIGGNMLFLWIFGNNVEDALGKTKFLIFYLVCGVAAALAQTAIDPHSLVPTLGASGAIAGVLGAYIIMYPDARVLTLFTVGLIFLREISAFWVLAIWIGLQVVEEVIGFGGMATGGVAYMAHIGGFSAGLIIILLLGGRALGQQQRIQAQSGPYRF
jgi:membrane associated rhomboid family serine protease